MIRCLLAALAMLATTASADSHRERAAVAAIDIGAGVPAYVHDKAVHQIEEGLAAAGYDVMPIAEAAPKETGELAACREGACLTALAAALGTSAFVIATFTSKDDSTIVVMRLYDGHSAQLLAEVHDVCDLCGESELDERVGIAASALRQHAVEARRREVVVVTPPAPVHPLPPPPPPHEPARSLVPGIAVGAAGVLAIGAGAYLIHLDGEGTCHPGDGPVYPDAGAVIRYPDPADHGTYVCRQVYRTKTLGFVSAGVGALAAAAGVVLVIRAHGSERALEVAPTAGGASVGVSWRW